MRFLTAFLVFIICFQSIAAEKLRVISLSPSLTETMYKLGRGDWLVGRSSACNYPQAAQKLPVAGKFGVVYLEPLAMLKPDIVIADAMKSPAQIDSVKRLGIRFEKFNSASIDDYLKTVEKLGKLFDCKTEAEQEQQRIKNGLEEYKQIKVKKRSKVLMLIWDNPLITCGKQSFLTDYIFYAGGVNAAADKDQGYFNVSEEWIMMQGIEVLLCPDLKKAQVNGLITRPAWKEIKAVKNHRVYSGMNTDILFRIGPRMLDAIAMLQKCIIPETLKKEN